MKIKVPLFHIIFKNKWGHSYDFLLSDHSKYSKQLPPYFMFHILIEKNFQRMFMKTKVPLFYIIFKNNWGHSYDFLLSDHSKYSKQLPVWFKKLDVKFFVLMTKKHPSGNKPKKLLWT